MRDISARELKGHNILAVERFQDSTRWMIEFSVQRPCSYGSPGDDMRLFLTEDGYQAALVSQKRREIKIKRYAGEGCCFAKAGKTVNAGYFTADYFNVP